jgi:nucleoside-diphosphate-sugar epimerase
LGSHLVARFKDEHELVTPGERDMDLRSWSQVKSFVKITQPEIVLHLAAKTEVANSFEDFEDFGQVNFLGTVRLAEACRLFNPKLRQFVLASTMETYGNQPGYWKPNQFLAPFDETTPQNPSAPYAVAKLAAEKYLLYLRDAYGQPYTILRQTNTYGRVNTDFFVMERIITQMLDDPNEIKLGAAEPWRNFLFIDDLVDLYEAVLDNPDAAQNEIFVTGPNNAMSIHSLVDMVADLLDWGGRVYWDTMPERPGEVMYLNSVARKAERLLGWKPKTSIYHGICATADRIKAHRKQRAA